ncbi:hypothetical protein [Anabaena sp. CCY 0017]|uniref:hypothetical protein n=1 Tax=Anabaena sp. CCY 0017 TaxID=3103866 RepID=UPI0039C7240F
MEYSYFSDDSPHSWGKLPLGMADNYSHIAVDVGRAIAASLLCTMPIVYINFRGLSYRATE